MAEELKPCPRTDSGKHNFGSWSTEPGLNEAGEERYFYQRTCYACGAVDTEQAGIIEGNGVQGIS